MAPRAYSYTSLSLFEACPASYGFKVQKKPTEPTEALDLGIASHTAIARYVAHCHREGLRADPDAVDPIADALELDRGRPLPEAHRKDARELLRDFASSYVFELVRPQVELQLAFDAGWASVPWFDKSTRWRSVLDLIERVEKGRIRITDWKTGHYVPTATELEASDQLKCYAWAAAKKWPTVDEFEVALYYTRQRWEHGPFEFTRQELESFGADLERRMARADAEKKFDPVPGDHCQRCDFRTHCPAYRAIGWAKDVPEDPEELVKLFFLAKAFAADLEKKVKARAKDGPLPTPSGKVLGFVQSRSWGIDDVQGVVKDLLEGGVKPEVVWSKLTLSKTALGQVLATIGERDMVGQFLDTYGSASISNRLKEYDPGAGDGASDDD